MAIQLRQLIEVVLKADEAGNVELFKAATAPTGQVDSISDGTLTVSSGFHRVMAASETATAVSMGDVTTAKWICVKANEDVTININGTEALPVKRRGSSVYDFAWLLGDIEFTSLTVTNPSSTSAVTVTIGFAGI
jgi:hypothetical protein